MGSGKAFRGGTRANVGNWITDEVGKMNLPYPYLTIRQYLETHRREMCDRLAGLVSIPSVRGTAGVGAPFGDACSDVLKAVRQLHDSFGYQSVLNDNGGYLLTQAGNAEGKHTIGVFAHADVVPPGDGWVFTSPFEPVLKDGFLVGRGTIDNKAAVIMSLYAAKAIENLGIPFSSRLLVFTGSDEESGMADVRAFAEKEEMPDISLVPDNGFPVCRGEKGILRWFSESGEQFSDAIVSVSGGSAFNVILGEATAILAYSEDLEKYLEQSISSSGLLTVERKGNTLILSSHCESGHASAPGDAVHGIYLISDVLSKSGILSDSDRGIFSVAAELTENCFGRGFGISFNDAEFGPLTCVNGIAMTESGRLSLSFDCRYGTSENAGRLISEIGDKMLQTGWNFRLHENSPGFLTADDDPAVTMLLKIYEDCTGKTGSRSYLSGGGTYARYLKNAFSMCDTYHPFPFDVPAGHGFAHQPDEMISVDGLLDTTAILAEMILGCDRYLNNKQQENPDWRR